MNDPFTRTVLKMVLIAIALFVFDYVVYLVAPALQGSYEVIALTIIVVWGVGRSVFLLRKRGSR